MFDKLERALIIPDTHRPYHDKKAYGLMIEVAKDFKPDEIVLLGDYADFYFASQHDKHPSLSQTIKEEIEDVNKGLDELDNLFPKAKKKFIVGNHEYRLERYINKFVPNLFGITDMNYLLNLNKRPNWTVYPYGPNQICYILGSKLGARHEPLGTSPKASANKSMCNLVYGHEHKIREEQIVSLNGENFTNFSIGWLGDKNKDKIFDYVKNYWQWSLGFGILYFDKKNNIFYHQKIHIKESGKNNRSLVFNGRLYRA